MGMNELFKGNLTGFSDKSNFGLNGFIHKVKLEVNEEFVPGNEEKIRVSRNFGHIHFICDHPFLFVIYDTELHQILFTGVYLDPL